jgi:hypothetical protein
VLARLSKSVLAFSGVIIGSSFRLKFNEKKLNMVEFHLKVNAGQSVEEILSY